MRSVLLCHRILDGGASRGLDWPTEEHGGAEHLPGESSPGLQYRVAAILKGIGSWWSRRCGSRCVVPLPGERSGPRVRDLSTSRLFVHTILLHSSIGHPGPNIYLHPANPCPSNPASCRSTMHRSPEAFFVAAFGTPASGSSRYMLVVSFTNCKRDCAASARCN